MHSLCVCVRVAYAWGDIGVLYERYAGARVGAHHASAIGRCYAGCDNSGHVRVGLHSALYKCAIEWRYKGAHRTDTGCDAMGTHVGSHQGSIKLI